MGCGSLLRLSRRIPWQAPASSLARCWIANDSSNLFAGSTCRRSTASLCRRSQIRGQHLQRRLGSGRLRPRRRTRRPAATAASLVRTAANKRRERVAALDGERRSLAVRGHRRRRRRSAVGPASGTIEAKIPLSAISTSAATPGNAWAYVITAIAYNDQATSSWVDDGKRPFITG